jgi:integrase
MNAPVKKLPASLDPEAEGRRAVLENFKVEKIQHLGREDLLAAKLLAGHGAEWGHWITPKSIMKGTRKLFLDIDLRKRLIDYLAKEPFAAPSPDILIDEGVLTLTRIALLMKLVPTAGRTINSKGKRLKSSSITQIIYCYCPKIIARAIRRKAEAPAGNGLFQYITEADVLEFMDYRHTRVAIERLHTLIARGVWFDAPPQPGIWQTTNPATATHSPKSDQKPEPYPPLPEEWLAQIGPRVLWVIEDMGQNLLRLLEDMREDFKGLDLQRSGTAIRKDVWKLIADHLEHHPWLDRSGQPLAPPFKLTTAAGRRGAETCEWPPRTWEHVTTLSVTLQTAHIFITLLLSAGRIGEIQTLSRDCVEFGRDGKSYLRGYTYKLADNLFGDARTWPAPDILGQSLGQQARLAAAWDWLPNALHDDHPEAPRFGNDLWISIGVGGIAGSDTNLNINQALQSIARRLDMSPEPGGKNVHAHRFRKTIGRLAGVTLFNSPLVLKRLFGHKSIEMTLHYILCDQGVREEAEKVLRELRIMHCAEALEEIHQAVNDGTALPGHGGPGAARLITAVRNEDTKLNQSGRIWTEGSAYDLALLLTMQGQGWRLIKDNIICSKAPGEDGLCQKKRSKGEPNTANCQPKCDNLIVFARRRRDVEQSIEQYLDIARQARDDRQLLVLAATLDNARDEWVNFPDLAAKYQVDPEVQALFALCEEPEPVEEFA